MRSTGPRAWLMLIAVALGGCFGGRTELWEPPAPCPGHSKDCDGDPSNGCEADLGTNAAHCGACGVVCQHGFACADSVCVPGESFVQIETIISTQFVRTADGRVFAWGNNQFGKANPRSSEKFVLSPE